jgi:hypothetical protein
MKKFPILAAFFLLAGLISADTARAAGGTKFRYFTLSAPLRLKMNSREAISEFTLEVTGAVVMRTKVPFQWNVEVDNTEGARTHLKAFADVGNSELYEDQLSFFQNFVTIGKILELDMGPPFDINLTLTIQDNKNDTESKVTVPLGQMRLTPVDRP